MIQQTIRTQGLEFVLHKHLGNIRNEVKEEIIPFKRFFHRLCSAFSITKKECWELLYHLQDRGVVEIVPYHGVMIR